VTPVQTWRATGDHAAVVGSRARQAGDRPVDGDDPERTVIGRNYFNAQIWKPALRKAGVPVTRANGTHALRHFDASALLDGG
jgi:hypothetical protein